MMSKFQVPWICLALSVPLFYALHCFFPVQRRKEAQEVVNITGSGVCLLEKVAVWLAESGNLSLSNGLSSWSVEPCAYYTHTHTVRELQMCKRVHILKVLPSKLTALPHRQPLGTVS